METIEGNLIPFFPHLKMEIGFCESDETLKVTINEIISFLIKRYDL